ncbi:MAG: hypothetical protein KGY75_06045, partial [Candidatus Cloacimonetes bacterium]|nr:hypothetical protein [Candidatus Cloacimonadota bacterium]
FISIIGLGFNYLITYLAGDPSEFTATILANLTKYFLAYIPLFTIVKLTYGMNWEDFIYFLLGQIVFALPIKIIVIPHVSMFVTEIIEVLPWISK